MLREDTLRKYPDTMRLFLAGAGVALRFSKPRKILLAPPKDPALAGILGLVVAASGAEEISVVSPPSSSLRDAEEVFEGGFRLIRGTLQEALLEGYDTVVLAGGKEHLREVFGKEARLDALLQHATALLRPGGRLVALVEEEGAFDSFLRKTGGAQAAALMNPLAQRFAQSPSQLDFWLGLSSQEDQEMTLLAASASLLHLLSGAGSRVHLMPRVSAVIGEGETLFRYWGLVGERMSRPRPVLKKDRGSPLFYGCTTTSLLLSAYGDLRSMAEGHPFWSSPAVCTILQINPDLPPLPDLPRFRKYIEQLGRQRAQYT